MNTYFLILNVIGFSIMGIDKYKAKRKAWRIKEKNLFIIAFIGGGIGSILGMYVFRHKIRKWYFRVFIPFAIIINVISYYCLEKYFIK